MHLARRLFAFVSLAVMIAAPAAAEEDAQVTVYKSPTCGCCSKWVRHLEENGFSVETHDVRDVSPMKRANGVPESLSSCHTAFVGGYVVEGHVPASDVKRLLAQRPAVSGLAVPGMPEGSPGMEGPNPEHYRVLAFGPQGRVEVFSSHGP